MRGSTPAQDNSSENNQQTSGRIGRARRRNYILVEVLSFSCFTCNHGLLNEDCCEAWFTLTLCTRFRRLKPLLFFTIAGMHYASKLSSSTEILAMVGI